MLKEDKQKLEQHIRNEIRAVKKDIVAYEHMAKPVPPDNSIGRLTRMEAINSKSIHEATLRKAKNTLAGLERALKMMGDPDFGLCVECGEQIPFKRLMIMPGTPFCVDCAGKKR